MTLAVAFRAAARREMADAAAWYEEQQAGLGEAFIREVKRCTEGAARHPLLYGVVRNDIRRVVARRFPYGIYYRCRPDRIVVIAVFHSSRDPLAWQRRS